MNHACLIHKIFYKFLPGIEYVVDFEKSGEYLYNIRLVNFKGQIYNPIEFTPKYSFEYTDNIYTDSDFYFYFTNFASTLNGEVLIYTELDKKINIILTPTQTLRQKDYGLFSLIHDRHRDRFKV
jgi:hypothetical protein